MNWILSLTIMMQFVNLSWAQDERLWRDILGGEFKTKTDETSTTAKWVFEGPTYKVDLDSDGKEEGLQLVKRDGMDWLDVTAYDKTTLLQAKLWGMGGGGGVYQMRLLDISKTARVLIIFLDEGRTEAKRFESSACLYFLTFDNKDLKTLKLTKGPSFWHEYQAMREQYWRRLYSLNIKDFDNDGTKDVAVMFNHMQSIWMYRGLGQWTSL